MLLFHCLWEQTVLQSVCLGSDRAVAPPREQVGEQVMTVLNAELKSTNSTYMLGWSRCFQGCVEHSVDSILCRPVGSIGQLVLVQVSRDGRFNVREDESLTAFGDYGGDSNWVIVIKAGHCTFLWGWDDGG